MENIIQSVTSSLANTKSKPKVTMKEGHLDQPISVMMTQDVWIRTFMHECAIIFGMPCVSAVCLSKTDRFQYAYALMSISTSMRRMSSVWKGLYGKVEPKDAAWEFCRRYYEKHGTMVVPASSEELEMASKLLPGLIKKKSVKE